MKKHVRFAVFLILIAMIPACASPVRVTESDPSFNQVETLVAMTFQASAVYPRSGVIAQLAPVFLVLSQHGQPGSQPDLSYGARWQDKNAAYR
jgi:hypothetical protein